MRHSLQLAALLLTASMASAQIHMPQLSHKEKDKGEDVSWLAPYANPTPEGRGERSNPRTALEALPPRPPHCPPDLLERKRVSSPTPPSNSSESPARSSSTTTVTSHSTAVSPTSVPRAACSLSTSAPPIPSLSSSPSTGSKTTRPPARLAQNTPSGSSPTTLSPSTLPQMKQASSTFHPLSSTRSPAGQLSPPPPPQSCRTSPIPSL